ncbi:MAG TPA: transposase [Candidatus Woesebacteria bacterium]|nr:transposase [Candidatus Woesebacteria bacterium]
MNKKRPSKTQWSEEEIRKKIILEYKQGMELEQIADRCQYHIKSVQRIIRNFKNKRSYTRRKGAGRPPKLDQSLKNKIRNVILINPWLSCQDIVNELNINVSREPIRTYLRSLGYRWRKPIKKPKLSEFNKEIRFNWALEYENYDFSHVIFADEASFWLHNNVHKMWMKKGEEFTIETTAHPDKVHVWGYITSDGFLTIETFQQNLDAKLLVTIMKESLTRQVNRDYGRGQWTLAYDNDPKHGAEETKQYLRRVQVKFDIIYLHSRLR